MDAFSNEKNNGKVKRSNYKWEKSNMTTRLILTITVNTPIRVKTKKNQFDFFFFLFFEDSNPILKGAEEKDVC